MYDFTWLKALTVGIAYYKSRKLYLCTSYVSVVHFVYVLRT